MAVIATSIILFGNATGFAAGPNAVTVSWATMAQTARTLLIVIVASRWCGLTWAEAGIGRTNLLRSTVIGAGIGLGLAAVLSSRSSLASSSGLRSPTGHCKERRRQLS